MCNGLATIPQVPPSRMSLQYGILTSPLSLLILNYSFFFQDRQRLIYRGRVLVDSESLSTYKVESGHSLHMVARPPGFVPPSATSPSTGAAATNNEATNPAAATNAAGARAGTIGQRLLMGMGVPPALGQGAGTGAGGAGATAANAAGLVAEFQDNPGVFNGEAFLSNILGLAGAGGGAAGGGGTLDDMIAAQMPQPQSLWNPVEGRGARGASTREATAAAHAGGAARGGAAAHVARGGDREAVEEGQMGLEHIRQGLLTLHTLLSGTATRTGQRGAREAPVAAGAVNPAARGSVASSPYRARLSSAAARGTEWSREVATSVRLIVAAVAVAVADVARFE